MADLDLETREQALRELAEARKWIGHQVERLSGWPYHKLYAGDYRVILAWDKDDDVLIIEAIGHRWNVYDRHLPP